MWLALVVIAYFCTDAIHALAGKATDADINVNANIKAEGSLSINNGKQVKQSNDWIELAPGVLGLLFGVFGIIYGRAHNHLRKDTVERLQDRIRQFEEMEDPSRSTSKLTKRGETRPEDQ